MLNFFFQVHLPRVKFIIFEGRLLAYILGQYGPMAPLSRFWKFPFKVYVLKVFL